MSTLPILFEGSTSDLEFLAERIKGACLDVAELLMDTYETNLDGAIEVSAEPIKENDV